jgi:predicted esterase
VHAHAHEWRVDPARVAAGGFSAGARTAFNAAFGEKARVAAVVALSGLMDVRDFRHHVPGAASGPAVLLIHGTNDLDYVVAQAGPLVAAMRAAGLPCTHATVAEAGHFYLAEAPARIAGQGAGRSVEHTMADFLAEHLAVR